MTDTAKRSRFSIDLPDDWQAYLAQVAKTHKLSQGEVIETLLANMHKCIGIDAALTARRDSKVAVRAARRLVKGAFEKLTPEQQRAALAAAGAL